MDRKKQITILTLAVVALIGGIYIVAKGVIRKSRDDFQGSKLANDASSDKNQQRGVISRQDVVDVGVAMGKVSDIAQGRLTVMGQQQSKSVNINGSTPVVIKQGNSSVGGQVADIEVGNAVTVNYNKETNNARMIILVSSESME